MDVLKWIAIRVPSEDYFWLDALCINQADDDEKGQQVRMMYQVYSQAEQVIAWADRGSEDGRLAMQFVKYLSNEFSRLGLHWQARRPLSRATVANIEGCDFPSARWTALNRFLQRPFFRRAWIVQELVAAKDITLRSGVYCISWTAFADVLLNILGTGVRVYLEGLNESGEMVLGGSGLSITYSLRSLVRFERKIPPFPYVISQCTSFGCTDPRDRIFAFLNMCSLNDDEALAPDYKRSAEEVFTATTGVLLTRENPMFSLLHRAGIGFDRLLTTLPSWVPDWTLNPSCMSFGITTDHAMLRGDELYRACGPSSKLGTILVRAKGNSIKVRGRTIDTVKSHYAGRPVMMPSGTEGARENHRRYVDWLLQLCHSLPERTVLPTGVPFFPDALSQTLVAGLDDDGRLSQHATNPHFADFVALVALSCDDHGKEYWTGLPKLIMERMQLILSVPQTEWTEDPRTPTNEIHRSAWRSHELYENQILQRRGFFTTEMNYVGLGPLLIQEDDEICLICGTNVPFLIRRREEGGFQLVGECYVHGLMQGEGMAMGVEQDIQLY